MVSTIASSAAGSPSSFWSASSLLVTRDGARILVADALDHRVRVIDTATRAVTTLVGTGKAQDIDGVGIFASISGPCGLAFDEANPEPESRVFIAARRSIRCLTFATGTFFVVGLCRSLLHSRMLRRRRSDHGASTAEWCDGHHLASARTLAIGG